jgi:hypothetical protein
MEERTFVRLTEDQIRSMARTDDEDRLAELMVPVVDESEHEADRPVSAAMPYHGAFTAYSDHVRDCKRCSDGPIWDLGCDEGQELAKASAHSMSAQDALAAMN